MDLPTVRHRQARWLWNTRRKIRNSRQTPPVLCAYVLGNLHGIAEGSDYRLHLGTFTMDQLQRISFYVLDHYGLSA